MKTIISETINETIPGMIRINGFLHVDEIDALKMFGGSKLSKETKAVIKQAKAERKAAAVDPRTVVGSPERLAALAKIAARIGRGEESEDFDGLVK